MEETAISLKGISALIVDDNATNRRILEEMLAGWEMKPVSVESGHDAIKELKRAAAQKEPYRLALLDMMMPEMDGFQVAEQILRSPEIAGSTLMMLSSADRLDDLERCHHLGINLYLRKPISRSELFNAILASIDQKVHVGRRHPRDGWPEPPRSLRILLAEDNPINQAFAVSLLNERGHSVEVADNGLRAIEAWEREEFDVVLMDVQMPEMDGPQATAVIGEKEKATDAHTQIIALTAAYAMKGDRERCLRAGMDGYVTKPIQVEQLLSLIEGWDRLPGREESEWDEGVFDMEALMKRARGRKEVMLRIVAMMLEQSPRLTKEIKEAIASGDCRAVEQAAHMLKGSAGHFGASPVSDAALKLERMGREGDLRGAKEARRGSRLAQPVAYGSDGRERGCG